MICWLVAAMAGMRKLKWRGKCVTRIRAATKTRSDGGDVCKPDDDDNHDDDNSTDGGDARRSRWSLTLRQSTHNEPTVLGFSAKATTLS